MKKETYVAPEGEEIKVRFEANFLDSGDDIPGSGHENPIVNPGGKD